MYKCGKDGRFLLFSRGPERVSGRILNFSNYLTSEKAVELLNVIFESSSPKGYF